MSAQEKALDGLCTDHLRADLKRRSVRGGVATVVGQGSTFLVHSVLTVVMARLLTPADFGLVAMVTAVTGLASAFADIGLSEATIQREDINHAQVSVLFWINVAVGLGLMAATAAMGPLLAWFYRQPRLTNIAFVLSLTFLISGLRVQPDAILKRQMRFTSLAIRDIAATSLGVAIAIMIALRGAGYWALVVFPLTSNFTQMALSWLIVRWKPSLPRRDAKIGSLVAFGGNVALSYLMFTLNRSVDNILIGWYWGAAPLGLYSKAYNLLMLPLRQLNAPLASVAVPTFSRIHSDRERFARYYLRATNLVTWISAPVFGFLFVAAAPVITLILGRQWRGAAPVFQILAITALGQLLLESTVWLLVSRGRSDRLVKLLLITSPVIIGSFVIGLPLGIKGVALSYSLIFLATLPWILKFAFRDTELTLRRLGRAMLYPVFLCLLGVFLATLALRLTRPEHVLAQLLVAAVGFVAAYSLSVFVPPVRKEIVSLRSLLSELRLSRNAVSLA